jgi:secernin
MCDTILAPPRSTAERVMLFGKNSDRQRNEAQAVEYFPSSNNAQNSQVSCTYLTIPQARHTHAVLLCRPFWIWGAEMGANECGLVIGNEGLTARSPAPEKNALTGMDLLRLALERASTAAEAVQTIAALLNQYGQGGNCGHLTPAYYNNGFMIADPAEAFVMETVGREYLVERVRGARAVSNTYSIGRGPDIISEGLRALVSGSGWSAEADPNYAEVIADKKRQHVGGAEARHACSKSLLNAGDGRLTVADMMNILRDHGTGSRPHPEWRPECTVERTLCLHAGSDERPSQTVGSMVSELAREGAVHWVTGTSACCTSIFKPVLIDVPIPLHGPRPTDRYDARTLWWRHERLHRAALHGDFGRFIEDIRVDRDALEADFRARIKEVSNGGSIQERTRVVAQCWNEATEMEGRWHKRIAPKRFSHDAVYTSTWETLDKIAGVEPSAASP